MCGTKEILWKNVRDKGNPIEKCAGQRKSYRKMCGTKEILLKNVRDKGNPIEILEKTSQSKPHPSPRPRDPRKSWKKPHNLRTIPWTSGNPGKNLTICGPSPGPPEILEKTSQSEPHPSPHRRDPWKSWKKPHNLRTIPWTAGNPGKNLTI